MRVCERSIALVVVSDTIQYLSTSDLATEYSIIQAGVTAGKTLDNGYHRCMYLFIPFYECLSTSYAPIIRLIISISHYWQLFLYRYWSFLKGFTDIVTSVLTM